MASITGDFVAKLAAVWHRFTVSEEDRETLATMLVPMDEAGERAVRHLAFDMEPADFDAAIEDLAPRGNME
jgi:hypothetical protein